jgi:hypothetical protein
MATLPLNNNAALGAFPPNNFNVQPFMGEMLPPIMTVPLPPGMYIVWVPGQGPALAGTNDIQQL